MGENTNSNLILLPNNPTAGSEMLSQMTSSFIASQQMGENIKAKDLELKRLEKAKK